MYRAVAQVFGVWALALVEAVAFAAVPGAVAWAITTGGDGAWLVPTGVFILAICTMGVRQFVDTRVYVNMWREKIISLFGLERASARAKAARWSDAIKRLETLGPNILRGGAELIVGSLYIGSVSAVLGWLMLLAGLPYILSGWWATKKITSVAQRLNELALHEAELYESGDSSAAQNYYDRQYFLAVEESDTDAIGYFAGNSAIWLLRFSSLYVLHQHGTSPAVLFAVLMYSQRMADGLDRCTVGMRNLSVVLTILKV